MSVFPDINPRNRNVGNDVKYWIKYIYNTGVKFNAAVRVKHDLKLLCRIPIYTMRKSCHTVFEMNRGKYEELHKEDTNVLYYKSPLELLKR